MSFFSLFKIKTVRKENSIVGMERRHCTIFIVLNAIQNIYTDRIQTNLTEGEQCVEKSIAKSYSWENAFYFIFKLFLSTHQIMKV
jgi:hypothetical protein